MSTRIMRLVAQPRRSRRALSCVSSSRPHSAENSVSQVDPNKESTSQSASVTCHSGSKAPCHCAERTDLRGLETHWHLVIYRRLDYPSCEVKDSLILDLRNDGRQWSGSRSWPDPPRSRAQTKNNVIATSRPA
jgi:hypothetical protein